MFSVLTQCNPDAKRLFDDLLSSYNKLVRPVINVTDAVTVKFKLKLSQLIDVVRKFFFARRIKKYSQDISKFWGITRGVVFRRFLKLNFAPD